MSSGMSRYGRQRGLKMFADWTDRIAAGELPPVPPRPQGVERNLVLTMWDWGHETSYVHDEITTDKRNPRVNANGPVYSVSSGHGGLVITDPIANTSTELRIPVRANPEDIPSRFPRSMPEPSYYYGDELLWNDPADPHNPMIDGKGRVWMTSTVRGRQNAAWCREGSDHSYAQYFPLDRSGRQASYYDPAMQKFRLVDTCFGTHHLQFGEDPDDTLWFSGGGLRGWLAEHTDAGRDGRRAGGAGMVPEGVGHKRGWQDHAAVERAGRPGRPDTGHADCGGILWRDCQPGGPRGLGRADGAIPGPYRPARPRGPPARRPASPRYMSRRRSRTRT